MSDFKRGQVRRGRRRRRELSKILRGKPNRHEPRSASMSDFKRGQVRRGRRRRREVSQLDVRAGVLGYPKQQACQKIVLKKLGSGGAGQIRQVFMQTLRLEDREGRTTDGSHGQVGQGRIA